jgi:hypothetical protein
MLSFADHLAMVASKNIFQQQRGFVNDMHIVDCIIIASEAINMFCTGKQFDTLEWSFLLKVWHRFVFSDISLSLVGIIPHSAKLSVLVNGKFVGYFSCVRGVRQADPLSLLPFLFSRGGS